MPSVPSGWLSVLRVLAASVAVSLVVFLLGETVLRVAGIGWSGRFFVENPDGTTVSNPRFGRLFYPEELLRGAYPAKFATRKPEGVFRVFVLGESAVAGTPEPAFSLTRALQVLLQQACPDETFEVINAGVTAMNSHGVRLIAHELVRYEPDAVIVYLGNNEVVGPFGPGSILGGGTTPNALVRPLLWFRSTRIGQIIQSMADSIQRSRRPEIWRGMDMFAESTVAQDADSLDLAYENFAANLRDIASILRKKRVPTLLCSVASNLVDCPPLGPGDVASLGSAHHVFEQARRKFAEGDRSGAMELFRAARDKDTLRFRADSRINDTVRQIASESGCDFADLEKTVGDMQGERFPEEYPLFFEHVHLTFEGNVFVASVMAQWLAVVWSPQLECLSRSGPFTSVSTGAIGDQLGYSAFSRGSSIAAIRDMLRKAPFDRQSGNEGRIRYWEQQLEAIGKIMTPDYLREWTDKLGELSARNPGDGSLSFWHGRHLEKTGDLTAAADAYERSLAVLPGNSVAWSKLGDLRAKLGDGKGAAAAYREALKIFPANPVVRKKLAAWPTGVN
jgi:lysophospholipase L1-like esterase